MNMKAFLALFFLALVASTAEILEEDDVIVVTDDNFSEVYKNEYVLVEFYAPWCGHCKKLTPEYAAAAKTLKTAAKPVPLAKCDATVHKKASEGFEVKGFPTIKFLNNGTPIDYNGGRQSADIVAWVNKRTGDVSALVADQAAIDALTAANKLVVVYFTEAASGAAWDAFKATAMGFDKIVFAHSTDAALAAANKSALGQLVLFKQFDEGRNDYTAEVTAAALKEWLNTNRLALVMEFDDAAIEAVFQQGTPTVFIFHNDSEESKAARAVVEEAAKELKGGKVIFSYVTPANQHWQRLADYIGANTAAVPALQLVKAGGEMEKYKYDREITVANIKAYLEDWTAGKLVQHVKSEDIPATNDEPVKVVVGKNYEDLVINNNKDVLVKFYAPWCGHCKKIIPDWNEAAKKLEVNPNVVIAKCDATANEVPNVQIKGYPTLKFFPGNAKTAPIDFEGERTTAGILSWLKEKTTHAWVELEEAPAAEEAPKKDDL